MPAVALGHRQESLQGKFHSKDIFIENIFIEVICKHSPNENTEQYLPLLLQRQVVHSV